jgi:hypothetical protein
MTVSPSQPEARSRAPMAYVVLRSQTKEGEGIDGHSLGNGTAFSAVAAPNLEKPRHGSRVSFNRLNLRCFPWRLPILEAARQYAREECLIAWDIFHGNVRVESSPEQLAFTALHRHLNTRRFRSRLNV